jgi:hypothetical protein
VAAALAGCAHPGRHAACPARPTPPVLAAEQRQPLEPDPQVLPASATDATAAAGPPAYHGVTSRQAQCLAVRNSSVGNLLDGERQADAVRKRLCSAADKADELLDAIRGYSAQEARNQSAGIALELLYRLAEGLALADLGECSRLALDEAIAEVEKVRAAGLTVPIDLNTLQTQRTEAVTSLAKLRQGIDQINDQLRSLLGLAGGCGEPELPVWPVGDFGICLDPIDCDRAVRAGLDNRPELSLLRRTLRDLDANTLPAVRKLLSSVNGFLGSTQAGPLRGTKIVLRVKECLAGDPTEVVARRRQLEQLLADREQQTARDIREQVEAMRMRQELVLLARDRAEAARARVEDREARRKEGVATPLELTTAKIDWYKARSEYITEVMAWQVARARLRQAQGTLVLECLGPDGMCADR